MLPQFFPASNNGITGEIRAFVGNLPHGWLECNGATFDGNTYPRLKTVLGGTTLPDLRNAALRGADSSNAVKSKSGSNTVAIPYANAGTDRWWDNEYLNQRFIAQNASLDVRGVSYYVKFAICAL